MPRRTPRLSAARSALRAPSLPGPWQAFGLWSDLALRTGEMLTASAQVIGHRTQRMHSAGAQPSARDRREFSLMGSEKVEAALASSQAMTQVLAGVPMDVWTRAWRDWMGIVQATSAVGASRNLGEAMARQSSLLGSATRAATSLAKVGEVGAQLAHHGLKPIHAKATANARRLARKR